MSVKATDSSAVVPAQPKPVPHPVTPTNQQNSLFTGIRPNITLITPKSARHVVPTHDPNKADRLHDRKNEWGQVNHHRHNHHVHHRGHHGGRDESIFGHHRGHHGGRDESIFGHHGRHHGRHHLGERFYGYNEGYNPDEGMFPPRSESHRPSFGDVLKGMAQGAAQGAAIGSVIPGVGTGVGAVVGGIWGGIKKLFG